MLSIKVGKGGSLMKLSVRMNNRIYVLNEGAADVDIPYGAVCAGFGRGKFRARKDDEEIDENEFLFSLESSDAMVLFNQQLTTVGAVYNDKLRTSPGTEIKVAYHKIEEVPGESNRFVLKRVRPPVV